MELPRMGQGTWHMGDDPSKRADEVTALREGVSLGMTLVDTAEMYGEGGAEEVVAMGKLMKQLPREEFEVVSLRVDNSVKAPLLWLGQKSEEQT